MGAAMKRLVDILRAQKGLINYAILNYFDKGLNFIIPLLVLHGFNDRTLYNEIEYIYSVAAIAVAVIELGVRSYLFYAYRQAEDRDQLVKEVKGCFLLQFVLYQAIGAILVAGAWLMGADAAWVWLFIIVRSLYMYFVTFMLGYYVIRDKPSKVYLFSFLVNLATVGLLATIKFSGLEVRVEYLFLSQIGLLAFVIAYFVKFRSETNWRTTAEYIKKALVFAWPIILNVFLFMFISNYGKIYAQNFLSQDEMFHISFAQRIAIIIQLAHVSIAGYLSKRIFIDEKAGVDKKVLILYTVGILGSTFGAVGLLWAMQLFDLSYSIDIDVVTLLIFGYTIAWCYAGFLELYINRMNKNKFVLLFSGVSSCLFVLVLLLKLGDPLYSISLGMQLSMACNLVLIVSFILYKSREAKLC